MPDTPTKPKPAKLVAEKLTPDIQRAQAVVADAQAAVASAKLVTRTAQNRADKAATDVVEAQAKLAKAVSKLGAEKMTPEEQKRRFEDLARELECDESEESFDAALRVIAKQKPKADGEAR
jgi:diphthamide synthase (EF-2-diphthine--ammonia ligase)